jgi:hypothetical protein
MNQYMDLNQVQGLKESSLYETRGSSVSRVALATFSRIQVDLPTTRREFLSATRLTSLIALPVFADMGVVAPQDDLRDCG